MSGLLLALDSASPTVSVAVGVGGETVARRSIGLRRSSEALLRLVAECLEEAGARIGDVEGILALRGPGSFTGLRVGLASALGLHQALGRPATAVPTLEVLAVFAGDSGAPGPAVAVVDALRGEWFAQGFDLPAGRAPGARGGSRILAPAAIAGLGPASLVGFGAERLALELALEPSPARPGTAGNAVTVTALEPEALAPAALRLAALRPIAWDPATLSSPYYLRAPAVTVAAKRPREPRSAAS